MVTNKEPELVLQQLEASHQTERPVQSERQARLAAQDRRLLDLVVRYRAGESVGEQIVLELLPTVALKAERMSPIRLYGREDLRQELIAEIFHLLPRVSIRRPDFMTRRLVLAAAKRLVRRLERQWYSQLAEWYRGFDPDFAASAEAGEVDQP